MTTSIASLSIAARAVLNMHSLNNEGGEGNQIQTRMVEIVGHDGNLHSVNAISGDMLKHVLMEHFYQQAVRRGLGHAAVVERVIAADLMLIGCGWAAENGWGAVSLAASAATVAILLAALTRGA